MKYLRADIDLRQSFPLSPDGPAQLEKAFQQPLDAHDEKLAQAAGSALVEFDHGADLKRCDWELSVEDGPFADTAHRGAIEELVAVSGIRARLRFRDGDSRGAIRDAVAAMAAARDLTEDGTLTSVLIGYRLEDEITEMIAANMGGLSPAALNRLERGLQALPPGSSLAAAFVREKVDRNDFLPIVRSATSRGDLIDRLLAGVPMLHANRARAEKIVGRCGGSVRGFLRCVHQQQAFYRLYAKRFALPPEEFEKIYNADMQAASKTNPLIRQFTPTLSRIRWAEADAQTRRALMFAAVGVCLKGPGALRRYPDPYDGKPFAYVQVGNGFRLESRLNHHEGIPISLLVRQAAEPNSK